VVKNIGIPSTPQPVIDFIVAMGARKFLDACVRSCDHPAWRGEGVHALMDNCASYLFFRRVATKSTA
jgi:hypothetical protein